MISQFCQKAMCFAPFIAKQNKYLAFKPFHTQIYSNSLNFKCKNEFFGLFSKEKKAKGVLIQDCLKDVVDSLRKENNEEKIILKVGLVFQLFNEIKKECWSNQVEISELVTTQINQIEEILEDQKDILSELATYSLKTGLMFYYASTKQNEKMAKIINEFCDEYFLQQILGQFDGESQFKIISLMSFYLLILKNQHEVAIELCQWFLNKYEGERVSSIQIIEVYNSIVFGYRQQNMHEKAFEEIENVIKMMNCQTFGEDLAQLGIENFIHGTYKILSKINCLIYYLFLYQQYDKGQKVLQSLLQHLGKQKEVYDHFSNKLAQMKNLNKHYTVLLSLNEQIATQIADRKEKRSSIDPKIELKFIHTLEKFLNLQHQFIDPTNKDLQGIRSLQLLQHIELFSPDGKQKLQRMYGQYDYLTI